MRILIDIGHPAHVHLFKHVAALLLKNGHKVHFAVRTKEFEKKLLAHDNFNFTDLGSHYKTTSGKIWGLIAFSFKLLRLSLKYKPDIFLSHGSMYAAFVSFIIRKPHISMEDTANREQVRLYLPFTDAVITSTSMPLLYGKKQIFYQAYHELFYLHPSRFVPDESVIRELGMQQGDPFVIMRFVALDASHDEGHVGISYQNQLLAIEEFSKYARIFISSQKQLPYELERYLFPLPPERMHDAMAFATLVYGESATMCSEAAMLGVPGIFLHNRELYYLRQQEQKYGLVFNFSESETDQQKSVQKGIEILSTPDIKMQWEIKQKKMLHDMIDPSSFLTWFIENWPGSLRVMREDPGFVERFKNM